MLSFVLVIIGLYIRLNIMETPEFAKLKDTRTEAKIPFATMITDYPREVMAGMGARYIDGVFFNIFGVYSIAYLTSQLKIPRTEALLGVCTAALLMCAFIPLFGRLSDKLGRTNVYFWGSLITGLSALPAFWIWMTFPGNPVLVWAALIIRSRSSTRRSTAPKPRCSAICSGRRCATPASRSCTSSPASSRAD